jgi:2-keto-4-pentenoate hydratase/2-oxohepta-3-ene-1,7-dioic acid hydratase in catechol pathway
MSELPITRPGKVLCVGLNYRAHAQEAGLPVPTRPLLFAKFPSCLIGPGEPIWIPPISEQVDWEAELGVVIGETARRVPARRALDIVAGYVPFNDVSARDVQRSDGQWTRGKSLDTFGPVGAMVPASQVADPQTLRLTCRVDGEVVQDGVTADMVFGVDEIIAFASEAITLEPGDLIATGTPAGIGGQQSPPRYLHAGENVEVEVQLVGTVGNPVRGYGPSETS